MSDPKDPVADWRKYPKGPNFLGIVLGACAFILIAFVVLWFVVRRDGQKMIPHGPNPTPNSLVQPLNGGSAGAAVRA
jgi:hypothetical protein